MTTIFIQKLRNKHFSALHSTSLKEKRNPIMDNPMLGHVHAVVTFKDHIIFLLFFYRLPLTFKLG